MTELVERHFAETISSLEALNNEANIRLARLLDNPEPEADVTTEIEVLTTKIQNLVTQIQRVYAAREYYLENIFVNAQQQEESNQETSGAQETTAATATTNTGEPVNTGEFPEHSGSSEPRDPNGSTTGSTIGNNNSGTRIIIGRSGNDDVILLTGPHSGTAATPAQEL